MGARCNDVVSRNAKLIASLSVGAACGEPAQSTTASSSTVSVTVTATAAEDSGDSADSGIVLDVGGGDTDRVNDCVSVGDGGAQSLSYIWISNTTEGTVSKINTRTGVEEGRYASGPDAPAGSPSRTSVNLFGDAAVSNRDPGSVTKIAAQEKHCDDRNGDGVIQTSNGPHDVLPWGEDECVLWNTPIDSDQYLHGPRPTAWEGSLGGAHCPTANPRLWIGYADENQFAHYVRLDGDTGTRLDSTPGPRWRPYGGAVNANGDLWVTGLGGTPAVKVDAQTLEVTIIDGPGNAAHYGMTVDKNGVLWSAGSNTVNSYDETSDAWNTTFLPDNMRARGFQIDRDGIAWISLGGGGTSICGVAVFDTRTRMLVDQVNLAGCIHPWGVSVDADQKVWVVDKATAVASRIDPATLQVDLEVTGLVSPYTYSDMTGVALDLVVHPPEG